MDGKILLIVFGFYTIFTISEAGRFFDINNYRYFFSHPLTLNWFQAQRHCIENGLILVDIKDEAENNRILSILKLPDYANEPVQRYWTSGTDLGTPRKFYWASTGKSVTFADYSPPGPDNVGGNENCLEILLFGGIFKWNDHQCEVEKVFICRSPEEIMPVRVANASIGYTYVSLLN